MSLFGKNTYGLIGYPLGHSLSPLLHNAVFKQLNIPGSYNLFVQKPEQIDSFLADLKLHKNIKGLNITVPYKEKVLSFLDVKSEAVKKIGACNTIVNRDNLLEGFNTDYSGFMKHISKLFELEGKKIALLGAGGAAKALVYALIAKKVRRIVIYDIDLEKAKALSELAVKLLGSGENIEVNWAETIDGLEINKKDLLINATPVGLKNTDEPVVDKTFLHNNLFVYDLIYNPAETKLLTEAKKIGTAVSNGLGMLVYQAAESFIYFTGVDKNVEEIAEIMEKAIKEKVS